MSIYSQKNRWKILLALLAILIVIASLWYTNRLVKKISNDERSKLELWAKAIQKKANLVRITSFLFEEIKNEERKKAEFYAKATQKITTSELYEINEMTSFILEFIRSNTTIPVILSDGNKISGSRNLDSLKEKDENYLQQQLEIMKKNYPPIEFEYYKGKKNYLYYNDSKVFAEIKLVFDSLTRSFISEVVSNTASVPVIYTDSTKHNIVASGNIDSLTLADETLLNKRIIKMSEENKPIEIELEEGVKHYIFYEESLLLKQLKYYPYVQFTAIGIFLIIAYSLFSTARKSEQNQVWVGMSKETAHQLGTPISSLMAWVELLKSKQVDESIVTELNRDVDRLNTIAERFSKVGSEPSLQAENIVQVIENFIDYMKKRSSKNITFEIKSTLNESTMANLNVPLFEWVIENLCKNAIDAMDGKGKINIDIFENEKNIIIDFSDTGKGIPKGKLKTVFEPGFTTKKRGWGLGLSLCKRIIENYHKGKISVKKSEPNQGTTFRIVLNHGN
jgi:signal transduction histidine kinase